MEIIKNRNKFFLASLSVILIGLMAFIFSGVKLDIDFKGGTSIKADIGQDFDNNEISKMIEEIILKKPLVQKVGANQKSLLITTDTITTEQMEKVISAIKEKFPDIEEPTTRNIQPAFGKELVLVALKAIGYSLVVILIYVAIRFRVMGVSAGLSAIVALAHDVLIMLAIYAIFKVPINSVFIATILTIIGYSINDTLVVYDRIRENKKRLVKETQEQVINTSIKEVLKRCINTSLTTVACAIVLLVVAIIYNQQVLKEFAFPLIIGLLSGTYSSIFIAAPTWYILENALDSKNSKKGNKKKK